MSIQQSSEKIGGMNTKINRLKEIDKTKNPFKVPDNYFAQFNKEIMNHLPEREISAPREVSLWEKAKPWIYLAAMFAGLYVTINFLMKAPEISNMAESQVTDQQALCISNNDWSTAQITEEEFYQYLEEQLIDDSHFDYMYHQYYLN